MSELIDRQQAITALAFAKETGTMKCGELKGVIEVLNRLPSAGPTFDARDTQYNLPIGTDYISRQQAIKVVQRIIPDNRANGICEELKKLPPIQPAEPKRGRWIEDKGQQTLMQNFIERGEVWRVCSVCGAGHMIGHKYAIDKAYHDRHHNFCPNCGAKMEVTT